MKRERKEEPEVEKEEETPKKVKRVHEKRKWQERWHSICQNCFDECKACPHFPEKRLRLLIVGHNPSEHAWTTGYSYSNPSNRMWSLLTGDIFSTQWKGIVEHKAPITVQNILPSDIGVGMSDLGLEPGNDAGTYGKIVMKRWREDFIYRLKQHAIRVCTEEHNNGEQVDEPCNKDHYPVLIAFCGKRQFSWMFDPPLKKVESFGRQEHLPEAWPCGESEVWVLPSSSGRAAMTKEQRVKPYQELAERLHQIPWPLDGAKLESK